MVFVTSIISSQEWIRLRDAAAKRFPNEVLARGEIMRRYCDERSSGGEKSERTGSGAAAARASVYDDSRRS
jgi:hypothetical protein